jgi:hypothetical protein
MALSMQLIDNMGFVKFDMHVCHQIQKLVTTYRQTSKTGPIQSIFNSSMTEFAFGDLSAFRLVSVFRQIPLRTNCGAGVKKTILSTPCPKLIKKSAWQASWHSQPLKLSDERFDRSEKKEDLCVVVAFC